MHYDPILTEYNYNDPCLQRWKRSSQVLHLLTQLWNPSSVSGLFLTHSHGRTGQASYINEPCLVSIHWVINRDMFQEHGIVSDTYSMWHWHSSHGLSPHKWIMTTRSQRWHPNAFFKYQTKIFLSNPRTSLSRFQGSTCQVTITLPRCFVRESLASSPDRLLYRMSPLGHHCWT